MRNAARKVVVDIYKPSRRCADVVRTLRVRGRVAARVVARKTLPVHETTRPLYHTELWKRWSATLTLPGGRTEEVDAPLRIVPSVGELGYW